MSEPFLAKLRLSGDCPVTLSFVDEGLLRAACDDVQTVMPQRDIVREGETPEYVHLILEGWACRYKMLADGSRQITAFMIPGDFCDIHITMFSDMDHSIGTLSKCSVATIPRSVMSELLDHRAIAKTLWWMSLVDEAILRAWVVNIGRRDAHKRLAHLVCELHARLSVVGHVVSDGFAFPLTQDDLADAVGLTSVHVNRTLKRLREEGLVALKERHLRVLDIWKLRQMVSYDANYLHLAQAR